MVDVWDTPGGRRWAAPVRSALERATCVIVVHPDLSRPPGLVDAVAAWCSTRRPVLQHLAVDAALVCGDRVGNVELVAQDLAQHLQLDVAAGARTGPVDVAGHEGTDGAVIHVDARALDGKAASTWCTFAAAVAAGTKDMAASERAAIVVHVAGDRVEVPDSDTNLRVLWWWGALSALDVTVAVDAASREPLDVATIVEVARWDIDLAERLATRWDGNPETLKSHITRRDATASVPCDVQGAPGPIPGTVRDAWAAGLVDSWGGRRDPHASLVDASGMERRRWHAQVRVVYPWLEELRADVAAIVAEVAAGAGMAADAVDDLAALELGPLRHRACFEARLGIPRPVRDVLDRAITARNSLAHLSPVDAVSLGALARAAAVARCTPGPTR